MSTSAKISFLSEILDGAVIPIGKLAYFRERFRDRLYELVVSQFLEQEKNGLTKADIARRIGRKPEQITRWLGAPGNWTIETVSDLLLAISKGEPQIGIISLENRSLRNFTQPEWLESREPKSTNAAHRTNLIEPTAAFQILRSNAETTVN